ncbi:MAG: methylthioribose kinase [Lysinibacillus sp.]
MIQKFVELGEGYGDIYELCELIQTNKDRFHEAFIFTATKDDRKFCSLAVAFKPVGESKFMPIYICREGIPVKDGKKAQRVEIFEQAIAAVKKVPNTLEIKHSSAFADSALYYQYLIGILRLNRYIPPMS